LLLLILTLARSVELTRAKWYANANFRSVWFQTFAILHQAVVEKGRCLQLTAQFPDILRAGEQSVSRKGAKAQRIHDDGSPFASFAPLRETE